jgi:uncharacterized protein YuzE
MVEYVVGRAFRSLRTASSGLSFFRMRSQCTTPSSIVTSRSEPMKIKYFEDTDTALLELGSGCVAETRELSEDIYLDMDAQGHIVSITVEHAGQRGDLSEFSFQRVTKKADKTLESTL